MGRLRFTEEIACGGNPSAFYLPSLRGGPLGGYGFLPLLRKSPHMSSVEQRHVPGVEFLATATRRGFLAFAKQVSIGHLLDVF